MLRRRGGGFSYRKVVGIQLAGGGDWVVLRGKGARGKKKEKFFVV